MTNIPHSSRSNYLAAKVNTASQPDLHLMLIEGALRFGRQAEQAWSNLEPTAEVDRLLDRTTAIVEALIQGFAAGKTEVSKQLEEQYAFIFRELASSRINHDRKRLASALTLLDYERETWKLACEKLATEKGQADGSPTPPIATPHAAPSAASESLSLEA